MNNDIICSECNDHLDKEEGGYCHICWGTKVQIINELQKELSEARGKKDILEEEIRVLKAPFYFDPTCESETEKENKKLQKELSEARGKVERLKKNIKEMKVFIQ